MYQKLVDLSGANNYIVILRNYKILYSESNKVKMLPEMKINHSDVSSFDSTFTGTFTYGMMKGLELDDAVKFANTAAAISLSKIGEEPAIPTLDEALDNSGLRDKFQAAKEVYAKAGSNIVNRPKSTEGITYDAELAKEAKPTTEPAVEQPAAAPQDNSQVTETAFGQAPIPTEQVVTEPTPEVQTPQVEPVQPTVEPAPIAPETPQPVEMPQIQAVPQPTHEETNIFG